MASINYFSATLIQPFYQRAEYQLDLIGALGQLKLYVHLSM